MISTWRQSLNLSWRKFKRSIEWVIFGLFDIVVLFHHPPHPDETVVAIVQLKLLGDYVLWWPYALGLIKHMQAQNKHVVLVINATILPLATQHFPGCTIIGINRMDFLHNLSTRAALLRQLRLLGTSTTYHDTYPRDGLIEDAVVRALGALAWGFDKTFSDRPRFDQVLSRRLYTNLLPPLAAVHQTQRHYVFTRAVGVPEVAIKERQDFAVGLDPLIQTSYFIIAPGASRSERRWPINHFIAIAQRILAKHPAWRCILIGSKDEHVLGETITQTLDDRVDNLIGKTSLLDLVRLIAHTRLVVGNDSGACHIAAACNVTSIAVVGGGHPGQFFPYDPHEAYVRHLPLTVSNPMDCFGCDWICKYQVEKHQPFPCIATISAERVWSETESLLSSDIS